MKIKKILFIGLASTQFLSITPALAATVSFPDTPPVIKTEQAPYQIVIQPRLTDINGKEIVPKGGVYTIVKTHEINEKGEEVPLAEPISTDIKLNDNENIINIPEDGVYEIFQKERIPGYLGDKGHQKEDGSFGHYRYSFPLAQDESNPLTNEQTVTFVPKLVEVDGTINFKKISAKGDALEGATFKLTQLTDARTQTQGDAIPNRLEKTFTTKTDGLVEFSGLPEGKYVIEEVKAPENYVLNKTKFYFEIKLDAEGDLDASTLSDLTGISWAFSADEVAE